MINLMHGDCLAEMKNIPDKSVDMVLADVPYGTTACKWDVVIPFDLMWIELKRITKDNGAICLFGSEPFSSHLRLSNLKMFKYDWIWDKKRVTGHLNAKKRPMVQHELIHVFYSQQCNYLPVIHSNKLKRDFRGVLKPIDKTEVYGKTKQIIQTAAPGKSYPRSIIEQTAVVGNSSEKVAHPTQKPVALLEYLIKTYTLENETVLDFTMGSGSTGVACKNMNRKFIGIEKDENYFKIAQKRINEA